MDKTKKQDYLIKTVFLQFIFCFLFFLFFYSIKYIDVSFLTLFKNTIFDELKKSIDSEQIVETFKKIDNLSEEKFILSDFSDELFSAEILGEGGKDAELNNTNTNVSYEKFKLNYDIFSPVIGGVVSSEFGERIHPITGSLGIHKGIDIALAEGSSIYAIFDGVVITAEYDQWNGNYIKILHDNNIMSVYCHCKELYVKEGENIRGGEIIASVGSTGQSTGPHIHFEIRIDDISFNPVFALENSKNAI